VIETMEGLAAACGEAFVVWLARMRIVTARSPMSRLVHVGVTVYR